MTTVKVFAPAKINLTLHVTGQQEDGYHLLDSLVVFADVGDWLEISLDDDPDLIRSLTVTGAESEDVPTDHTNLISKAARLIAPDQPLSLTLEKTLPSASGIGGGSADAAAALRGLAKLLDSDPIADDAALSLGADIPMCMENRPCRVEGIGEKLRQVTLPKLHAVLINPRVPVSTPEVFRTLTSRQNPPMPTTIPTEPEALIDWLKDQRNDLQTPAIAIAPVIGDTLAVLEADENCHLARMSGSGATCFGLFEDEASARMAAHNIKTLHPNWWVKHALFGDMSARAEPVS